MQNASVVLQRKLPPKCKGPGMFTVPCNIGDVTFSSSMLDLGDSINVMPYSVYESLNVGPLSETGVIISLPDKSSVFPRGVLEDVLVLVNQLVFPADVYVIDLEEQVSSKSGLILLRRLFLKTTRTKSELLELSNGDMLEVILSKGFDYGKLAKKLKHYSLDPIVERLVNNLEIKKPTQSNVKQIELPQSHTRFPPSLVQPPELELNVLPQHLKYAYLGNNETLPVIISNHLNECEEEQLCKVLKEHKEAMSWTISDIKGLIPSTCMHKILMEYECKPRQDAQKRLNPAIMEVVKKEILKLLDAGMIYPISDSNWVSMVQVMPKKTGIMVVENNKGAVLGQKNGRDSHAIYYASRTLDNAQSNYSTTEKELLAIVFALDKFRQYLLGTKVIVYLDHAALKYLMKKKDAKPRLM
uniref:Reverse transcriptase RNase H-like domain-containing protein n=1 Tax=Lactuca sativa TaxID=4236 RepID=A0A9R1WBA3_LACSA|nr:hypothetical protein LSAT_V11C200051490 [Lactuca sativa]